MTTPRMAPLSALRPAADVYGDVVTAYVDVSRTNENAAQEIEVRADNLRRELLGAGADEAAVEAVAARVVEQTGHGGETFRVVAASGGELVTDMVLASAVPAQQHQGPIAHLLELARAQADDVRYALVRVDRSGADITVAGTVSPVQREMTSEGDHDELTKVKVGGWSQRRYQMRVEDSIERNAETVAKDLDRLAGNERIDLVLITGDPTSVASVRDQVGTRVAERLEALEHGSRAEGASDDLLDEEVEAAIQRYRSGRIDGVLDRLGGGAKAVGVAETVEALRRGEVETLVLLQGALEDREAYVGPEPLLLGHTPDELTAFGVEDPAPTRLDEAMVRAAIGQDADLLPLYAPVSLLPDGVGAVLRFDTRPDQSAS
ncbi:baeRF2 domain-containing protein [Nocardioides renjunii]|uniref:baeRF2 domain-containing protein n=1 Tax=Nocardioides renjunii TaxID=3095075 RepID=UPI002AFEB0FD|nr:Vms1/Ankzf1 family peptidyl-tRNA hydrolase [Nocardioides sp. S-34]WQQ22701.1 Vms1/Ankzf1 family peptidyl-tRNA hydrolase [Nocardioides sp. S-34]